MAGKRVLTDTDIFIIEVLLKKKKSLTVKKIFEEISKKNDLIPVPKARSTIDRALAKLSEEELVHIVSTEKKRAVQLHYWGIKDSKRCNELMESYTKHREEMELQDKTTMAKFLYVDTKCYEKGGCTYDYGECWDEKIPSLEQTLNRKLTDEEIEELKTINPPGKAFKLISYINAQNRLKEIEKDVKPMLEILGIKS